MVSIYNAPFCWDGDIIIDTRSMEYIKKFKEMKSISPNLNLMIKACEKSSKVLIRDFGEVENLQVSKKDQRFCN